MSDVVNALICRASQISLPADAFTLCHLTAELLETEIDLIAVDRLPPGLPASVIQLEDDTFRILYRPSISPWSIQLSILHELAHILLGHGGQRSGLESLLLGSSYYAEAEQWEAEQLAHQLMAFLVQKTSNEASPVSARFVRILPQKSKPDTVNDGSETPVSKRFREVLPGKGGDI